KSLKLHDWIEVRSAHLVCVAEGDDAYAFIGESLVKLTPRGIDKELKLSGWWVYGLAPTCGGVAALMNNGSHWSLRIYNQDLELIDQSVWRSESAWWQVAASGCKIWLAEPPPTPALYVLNSGNLTRVLTLNTTGVAVPDGRGGVYYIGRDWIYRVDEGGVSIVGRGFHATPIAYAVTKNRLYLLDVQSVDAWNYIKSIILVDLEKGAVVGRIYTPEVDRVATDGEHLYFYLQRHFLETGRLERRSYVPNATIYLIRRGGPHGVRIGIEGVGETLDEVFGPVKLWPGIYTAYLEHCGVREEKRIYVADGMSGYVEMEFDAVTLRFVPVDFFRRPVESHIGVAVGDCHNYTSPGYETRLVLLKGKKYVIDVTYMPIERSGGRYFEDLRQVRLDVEIGRDRSVKISADSPFVHMGDAVYLYRDGITYMEVLTAAAVVLPSLYAVDKIAKLLHKTRSRAAAPRHNQPQTSA
ncbi:MAG: hypothetical protein ACPL3C_02525, partial [Pyrobaculum sp.]